MPQAQPVRSLRIFLSYASEQYALAEQTCFRLANGGHRVFFDRTTLQPGQEYDRAIVEEIRSSDLLVFFISPESVSDGAYARTELRFARETWPQPAGRVLPVMVADTSFEQVPAYLKAITVLQTEGDPAAEVVAAVTAMAARLLPGETFPDRLNAIEERAEQARRAHALAELDQKWADTCRRYRVRVDSKPSPWLMLVPLLLCIGIPLLLCSGTAFEELCFSGDIPYVLFFAAGVVGAFFTAVWQDKFLKERAKYRRRRKALGGQGPDSTRKRSP